MQYPGLFVAERGDKPAAFLAEADPVVRAAIIENEGYKVSGTIAARRSGEPDRLLITHKLKNYICDLGADSSLEACDFIGDVH